MEGMMQVERMTLTPEDIAWLQSTPHTTFLTPTQQAYFLFALLALFVIGFGILFYWQYQQKGDA